MAPYIGDDVWNPWEDEQANALSALHKQRDAFRQYQERIDKNRPKRYKVQIWGKAAIGNAFLGIFCDKLYNIAWYLFVV